MHIWPQVYMQLDNIQIKTFYCPAYSEQLSIMAIKDPSLISNLLFFFMLMGTGDILLYMIIGLWLRLECSLDCISGPVGYQQNIFILSLSAFLLK